MSVVLLINALLAALLAAPSPEAAIGQWKTETRHAIVDIRRCGALLCGVLVTSDGLAADPTLPDSRNRDKTLRGRRLRGMMMLTGFARDGAGWSDGSLYNPEDGGTYKGRLTPTDADHLSVRGCIVWPLCKTQTWTRVR